MFDPVHKSPRPTWNAADSNRCLGCGGSHWYVGAITAECAFCATALPLGMPRTVGTTIMGRRAGRGWQVGEWRR